MTAHQTSGYMSSVTFMQLTKHYVCMYAYVYLYVLMHVPMYCVHVMCAMYVLCTSVCMYVCLSDVDTCHDKCICARLDCQNVNLYKN